MTGKPGRKRTRTFSGNLPPNWQDLPMEEIEDAEGGTWTLFLQKAMGGWFNLKLVYAGEPRKYKANYWLSYCPNEDRWSHHGQTEKLLADPILGPDTLAEIRGIALEWAQVHLGFDGQSLGRAMAHKTLDDLI